MSGSCYMKAHRLFVKTPFILKFSPTYPLAGSIKDLMKPKHKRVERRLCSKEILLRLFANFYFLKLRIFFFLKMLFTSNCLHFKCSKNKKREKGRSCDRQNKREEWGIPTETDWWMGALNNIRTLLPLRLLFVPPFNIAVSFCHVF